MMPLIVHIKSLLFDKEHATRGIGMYTRLLISHLEKLPSITIIPPSQKSSSEATVTHYPSFDFFFPTLPLEFKKNVVVTIHDVIPLLYPDKYPRGLKGTISLKKQMLALKTVRAIITDSETSKQDIHKYLHVPLKKIHVVPLAANPELSSQSDSMISQVIEKYKLPSSYILYVGDIGYNKNIPQLIKMLKFLPDELHLVCIGKNFIPQDIPEWRWIETQIAMSDVAHRIHFVTNLAVDATLDLSAIYTGAVCYVQPSLYEGFGLPILEAMQCKVPVVSSNTPALLEITKEYALVAKPTAEELAQKVETVYTWSKKTRADFIKAAFDWSQQFSWDKTAEQTLKVYQDITSI